MSLKQIKQSRVQMKMKSSYYYNRSKIVGRNLVEWAWTNFQQERQKKAILMVYDISASLPFSFMKMYVQMPLKWIDHRNGVGFYAKSLHWKHKCLKSKIGVWGVLTYLFGKRMVELPGVEHLLLVGEWMDEWLLFSPIDAWGADILREWLLAYLSRTFL